MTKLKVRNTKIKSLKFDEIDLQKRSQFNLKNENSKIKKSYTKKNALTNKTKNSYSTFEKSHAVVVKISRKEKSPSSVQDLKDLLNYFCKLENEIYDESDFNYSKENGDFDHLFEKLKESCDDLDFLTNKKSTFNPKTQKFENDSSIHVFKHIIFSYPHCKSKRDFQLAIRNTLKDVLVNQSGYDPTYSYAIHDDTDNLHAHVLLSLNDKNNKKIKMNRRLSSLFKHQFAIELNKLGYTKAFFNGQVFQENQTGLKNVKIIDMGTDHYLHNDKQSFSYFIKYQDSNGNENEIWGKGLKNAISKNNLEVGDTISIDKMIEDVAGVKAAVWIASDIQRGQESCYFKHFTKYETMVQKDYDYYFNNIYSSYLKAVKDDQVLNSKDSNLNLLHKEISLRVGYLISDKDLAEIKSNLQDVNKDSSHNLNDLKLLTNIFSFTMRVKLLKLPDDIQSKTLKAMYSSFKFDTLKNENDVNKYIKQQSNTYSI